MRRVIDIEMSRSTAVIKYYYFREFSGCVSLGLGPFIADIVEQTVTYRDSKPPTPRVVFVLGLLLCVFNSLTSGKNKRTTFAKRETVRKRTSEKNF